MTHLTIAAEGICDLHAARKISELAGFQVSAEYNCRGKSTLDRRMRGYAGAGEYSPWLVLRDLDFDARCAPEFLQSIDFKVGKYTCLRIAVRSLEAWLIADRESIADWLGVSLAKIPRQPELLDNPKNTLAELALSSRKRSIVQRIAGRPADGSRIGAEYAAGMIEFIDKFWNVETAMKGKSAPSLNRSFDCLIRMRQIYR